MPVEADVSFKSLGIIGSFKAKDVWTKKQLV
jgi:hypothetical protein